MARRRTRRARSRAREHGTPARPVVSWLAWWVVLTGFYLLLVFKTEPAEFVAGAVCGAVSATGAELVRRHGRVRFRPGRALRGRHDPGAVDLPQDGGLRSAQPRGREEERAPRKDRGRGVARAAEIEVERAGGAPRRERVRDAGNGEERRAPREQDPVALLETKPVVHAASPGPILDRCVSTRF